MHCACTIPRNQSSGNLCWDCVFHIHNRPTLIRLNCIGLFQKISTTPYGRHWIRYLKISGFPRMTVVVFAGFQTFLVLNLEEFQNFAILWMVFVEFRSEFTKVLGNSWISSHAHQAFSTGFPMSSMRGVWIFSGIAHYLSKVFLLIIS